MHIDRLYMQSSFLTNARRPHTGLWGGVSLVTLRVPSAELEALAGTLVSRDMAAEVVLIMSVSCSEPVTKNWTRRLKAPKN